MKTPHEFTEAQIIEKINSGISERQKMMILSKAGFSYRKTMAAGKLVKQTIQRITKPADPYEFSTGEWV